MPDSRERRQRPSGTQKALIGAAVAAGAGAAAFAFARRSADAERGERISDAPEHTFRDPEGEALIGRTVTINKPRQELYQIWRDFTRFPSFMDNVESVERVDENVSRWTIKAPAGTTVEVVTRITEDRAGDTIAWESEPDSQIDTNGRVEFSDAAPDRGTFVRLTMDYDPPAGAIGRGIAKLLQREPALQARRDLRRFKQLMETGEVSSNAGPSARGEDPTAKKI